MSSARDGDALGACAGNDLGGRCPVSPRGCVGAQSVLSVDPDPGAYLGGDGAGVERVFRLLGRRDRLADVSPPRSLFCVGDAGLPAGATLPVRVAWLPGSRVTHAARRASAVYAVLRPAFVCRPGAGDAGERAARLPEARALTFRPRAHRDQAKRTGR